MSRAYCECPSCRRQIAVSWDWDTIETAFLNDGDGEVVTNCGDTYASKVVYQRHAVCPCCGARLCVEHELVPRFYASKEDGDED